MDKILIIDDSALDRNILKNILEDRYTILTADCAAEGFRIAYEENPILILLDIILPDMDGLDVLRKMKESRELQNIPVICLTALQDEKTEETGFLSGAVDYIRKPYNPNIVKARVAAHVKIQRYRRTIETKMSIDSLTGVYNRNDYEAQKQYLWESAISEREVFSAFLIDIDDYKQVNDTYGHQEGDYVLRVVADELHRVLPEEAYLARYGGEEFIVLLKGFSITEACHVAESCRQHIYGLQIHNERARACPYVTVSIGGATILPELDSSLDELMSRIDKQLYDAKEQGRNRVLWENLRKIR